MPVKRVHGFYDSLVEDKYISEDDISKDEFTDLMLAPGEEGTQFRQGLFKSLQDDEVYGKDEPYQTFIDDLGLTAEDTLGIHEDDHVPTTPSGIVGTDTSQVQPQVQPQQTPTENTNNIESVNPSAIAKGAQAGAGIGGAYVGARAGGVYDLLGMPAQPTQQQPAQQQQRPAADQEQQGYGGFMMPDTSQMGLNAPEKVSVTAPKAGISAAIRGIGSPVPVKNEGQYAASSWQDDVSMDYQLPAGAKVGVGDIVQGESIPYSTVFRNFVKSTVADAVKAADAAGSQASNDFLDKTDDGREGRQREEGPGGYYAQHHERVAQIYHRQQAIDGLHLPGCSLEQRITWRLHTEHCAHSAQRHQEGTIRAVGGTPVAYKHC